MVSVLETNILMKLAIIATAFILWYVITIVDPMAWPFLTFCIPFMVIAVGIALSKLHQGHTRIVLAGALILILVNSLFLNANTLATGKPVGPDVKAQLEALPDGSGVWTVMGFENMALLYARAEGKDLLPIIYWSTSTGNNAWSSAYYTWIESTYGLTATTPTELVQACYANNRPVYIVDDPNRLDGDWGNEHWHEMRDRLTFTGTGRIREVTAIEEENENKKCYYFKNPS